MSSSRLSPYILQELPDITESIKYPLKSVQRIKYTCFDVSKSLIAFGATSGGIYVFNRIPCEFTQLIPNKDGAITRVSISLDEKRIGFANGRGVVTVTECDQSTRGSHSGATSKEHSGNEVTAMVWSSTMLISGDDVGKISVLQLHSFIAKTMFHSTSQTIMNLDSRICQIDMKSYMLLVSTLTRCYICDTSQEQYRQIGQKLRDGEYGACFVTKETHPECSPCNTVHDFTELKKYNIVNEELAFAVSKEVQNTIIYCARPSSRLWEASIDGTVKRTHQFKQVLATRPMNVVTLDSYATENVNIVNITGEEGQSVIFSKIYTLNGAIFSFKKDALYFLNIDNVDNTLWFDTYKDIVDCKVQSETVYVWLSNGSLVTLKYMKIDKFLIKCYLDEKYVLCQKMCALFSNYLLSDDISPNLHILVGLRDKLQNEEQQVNVESILEKFDSLKNNDATQMKSGIYVVDNTHHAQTLLDDSVDSSRSEEYKFGTLPPEAMQTLKDISVSVSDKLITSKKILKEKWGDFEGKMKNLNNEKQIVQEIPRRVVREEQTHTHDPSMDEDIIFKESSQKAIIADENSLDKDDDELCKALYQYYRLSLVCKNEEANLLSTIEKHGCDITEICELMKKLEQHCVSIGAAEDAKYVASYIFLNYLNITSNKDLLDDVIRDEVLYKYFVDSCILVNMKTHKVSIVGCECGFPLPYTHTNETQIFSELIDAFIEKQWSTQTPDQCYDVCKRMPHLWRKILYLRRNEDLMNILRLLLQILDERLLHSFLPQFSLDTWDRTVQLYATLHANMCLNCGKKFHHIMVKDTLSWDDLGALMIKSVGGKNALKVMEKHAGLIATGELTIKFYHTGLLVTMFEKCDVTVTGQLTDTLYSSSVFEDCRAEICKLLRAATNGTVKTTALPITVAAKSIHWGLSPITDTIKSTEGLETNQVKNITFQEILHNLPSITNGEVDCSLCGLSLDNRVLIKDGGLWVFKCGHTFHGECLDLNKIRLCPAALCCHKIN